MWGIENPGSKEITRPSTYLLVSSKKTQIIVVLKGDCLEPLFGLWFITSNLSSKTLVPDNPLSKERNVWEWEDMGGRSSVYLLHVISRGSFHNDDRAGRRSRQGKVFVAFANVSKSIGTVDNLLSHCRKVVKMIVNAFGWGRELVGLSSNMDPFYVVVEDD